MLPNVILGVFAIVFTLTVLVVEYRADLKEAARQKKIFDRKTGFSLFPQRSLRPIKALYT
jgi:hypothetical protein